MGTGSDRGDDGSDFFGDGAWDAPHRGCESKRPAVRLEVLRRAGELRVPFTSGVLVGIVAVWEMYSKRKFFLSLCGKENEGKGREGGGEVEMAEEVSIFLKTDPVGAQWLLKRQVGVCRSCCSRSTSLFARCASFQHSYIPY